MATLAVPRYIGWAVDAIRKKDWATIDTLCRNLMIIVTGSAICAGIKGLLNQLTSRGIARDIRYDLFYSIIRKDIAFFDENKTGDLLSRIANDTSVIQNGLSINITMIVRSSSVMIVTIVLLAFINWKLTLVVIGGVVPMVCLTKCLGTYIRDKSEELQDLKGELGS